MRYLYILAVLAVLTALAGLFIHIYRKNRTIYDENDTKRLISICGLIIGIITVIGLIIVLVNYGNSASEDVSETPYINESSQGLLELTEESTENISDSSVSSDSEAYSSTTSSDYKEVITYDVEQYLKNDVQNIKNGDKKTIERWFGSSNIFTKENMQKALSGIEISKSKNGKMHVCVFNEKKVNEIREKYLDEERKMNVNIDEKSILAYIDLRIQKEVEDKSIYDCYELDVSVSSGNIDVTEELKEIITNGWYKGIDADIDQYKIEHEQKDSLLESSESKEDESRPDTENETYALTETTEFDVDNYKIDWDSLETVPTT